MLFIVINGVFAFLFLNLPFVPSFFLLFSFCENKYQKCLRKVIEYTKNIQKTHYSHRSVKQSKKIESVIFLHFAIYK